MFRVPDPQASSWQAFAAAFRHAITSVYALVIFATYVGLGALAHDLGFSALWLTLSTVLVWAAPAQVILVSSLGTGSPLVEAAIAVSLSAVRLLPMVVAMLPLMRTPQTRTRELIVATHFVAISVWIESLRFMPQLPPHQRMAFSNGVGAGLMACAATAGLVGFYLTAGFPPVLAAALLFITPISFLISSVRNSIELLEKMAFVFGLLIGPVLTWYRIELDLMWAGLIGGALAYGVRRVREGMT
jgi:predicted branched-subunit amino acid permease